MTIAKMQGAVKFARLVESDRHWFPKLVREFAGFLNCSDVEPLVIQRESIVNYLKQINQGNTDS